MTTALPDQHHQRLRLHRSRTIAVVAAVLVVLAAGAFYEAAQDDPQTTTRGPGVSLALTHHHLRGSGHTETRWKYAGTTSGGHVMLGG